MGYKERSEYQRRRYVRLISRLDADDDETEGQTGGKRGGHGNTRIPYGLCQREGIPIQSGWTPKDAWEALEGKGYNVRETYKNLKKSGKAHGGNGKNSGLKNSDYWNGHSEEAASKVKKLEDSIRHNKTETLYVVDEDGNSILTLSDGSKNSVVIPEEENSKLFNATLTHNHPSGSTFSRGDIASAIRGGLREIRVCFCAGGKLDQMREEVKSDGEYFLRRNYEVSSTVDSIAKGLQFYVDFENARSSHIKFVIDPIYSASGKTDEDAMRCNSMLDHYLDDWLRDNASKYGWTYKKKGGN